MIIYDLACGEDHVFEGWFQDGADFERQLESCMVACPACNSTHIRRIPSASHVNKGLHRATASAAPPEHIAEQRRAQEMLKQLHDYIENNFDNVGGQFADEARKIHYGEAEERGIRGTATGEQVKALKEEGISTLAVPSKPIEEDQLN